MLKKIFLQILFVHFFIKISSIKWNSESLLEKLNYNITHTYNPYEYYLFDPDGIFSVNEFKNINESLKHYSKEGDYYPYILIINDFDEKGQSNLTKYYELVLKSFQLNLAQILSQNYLNHQNLIITLICINQKKISLQRNYGLNKRLSESSILKIKKNAELYLEKKQYKNLINNLLSDINAFIDNDYDFFDDKENEDDDEPIHPFVFNDDEEIEEEDPWKDFNPKKNKDNDKKEEKEDEKKGDIKDDKKDDDKKENDKNENLNNNNDTGKIYKTLTFILIIALFTLCVLSYFLLKKFKIIKNNNVKYQRIIGLEFSDLNTI